MVGYTQSGEFSRIIYARTHPTHIHTRIHQQSILGIRHEYRTLIAEKQQRLK